MRLGQFSRKFDLSIPNIVTFLSEHPDFRESSFHPNIRLEPKVENEILSHFGIVIPSEETNSEREQPEILESEEIVVPEKDEQDESDPKPNSEEAKEELTPAQEITAVEGEVILKNSDAHEKIPQEKAKEDNRNLSAPEEKSISSDQLLQLLESEEPLNLEDIKLIKAPKRELAGLKVLGKVQLAEPKKKESKSEKASREVDEKSQRRQINEEEKEKRRLKAKQKKEAYEAKRERLQKEKEAKRLKEIKEEHYRQKLEQQQPTGNRKKKPAVEKPVLKSNKKKQQEVPKSLLGRFWRWMNT